MKDDDPPSTGKPPSRVAGPLDTSTDVAGYRRIDFPGGSYMVEGPHGEQVLVSDSGDMSVNIPVIRRVVIDDLSQVIRQETIETRDTLSHIVHFVGNGVLSYLRLRNGRGLSIEGHNLAMRMSPEGVVTVLGAASVVGEDVNRLSPPPSGAS